MTVTLTGADGNGTGSTRASRWWRGNDVGCYKLVGPFRVADGLKMELKPSASFWKTLNSRSGTRSSLQLSDGPLYLGAILIE